MKIRYTILTLLVILASHFAGAQSRYTSRVVTGKALNITQVAGASVTFDVAFQFLDETGRFTGDNVAVGDFLYINDGYTGIALPITTILTAGSVNLTVRVSNTIGIAQVPTGTGVIMRGSPNFKFFPWVSGNFQENQVLLEDFTYRVDSLLFTSGTVTNFSAGNLSPIFTTNVATPTTTPALTFTLNNQSANTSLMGPASGGPAAPTFRALVSADIPAASASKWTDAGAFTYLTSTSDRVVIGNATEIGSSYVLQIKGGGLIRGPGTTSGSYTAQFHNSTGTNNALTIRDDGAVGIGNASAAYKLDVSGDISVSPNSAFRAGSRKLAYYAGFSNYYFGNAGNLTGTGDKNVAIGDAAFGVNVTGNLSVAIGANALSRNVNGSQNFALGTNTLQKNVSGLANIGVGNYVLVENLGNYNVGIGDQALTTLSSGDKNVAIGGLSSFALGTGTGNVTIGHESFSNASAGSSNVIIGESNMRSGSGNNNVIIGREAFYSTVGDNNIAIGRLVGSSFSGGNNNILIGHSIQAFINPGSNQMSIGNIIFSRGIDGTGTTYSSGSIGIKENNPQRTLDVGGEFRVRDLVTDTPTQIVGADGDGDFGIIGFGAGLGMVSGAISITGIIPVANGGTGASAYTAGQVLFGNGTSAIASSGNFFYNSATTRLSVGAGSSGATVDITGISALDTDLPLRIRNSSAVNVMQVFNDGHVDIGTSTASSYRFNVRGPLNNVVQNIEFGTVASGFPTGLKMSGSITSGGAYIMEAKVSAAGGPLIAYIENTATAANSAAGVDIRNAASGGSPYFSLVLDGYVGWKTMADNTFSGNYAIGDGSTRMFNISPAGNVGIAGQPISGFRLYVNGSTRSDGTIISRGTGNVVSGLTAAGLRLQNTTGGTGDTWYSSSQDDGTFLLQNGVGSALSISTTPDVQITNRLKIGSYSGTATGIIGKDASGFVTNITIGGGLAFSGGTLSSTVTGTVNAANNGVSLSSTTVQWGGALIQNTTIDGNTFYDLHKDGRHVFQRYESNPVISVNVTGAFDITGKGSTPSTSITPSEDNIVTIRGYDGTSVYYDNALFAGVYTTASNGVWLQSRAESAYTTYYPINLNPNGGQVGIGRKPNTNALDALVTLTATGLAGSTVAGSVLHWENSEGNGKAVASFGVGTDVLDGEVGYFDAADIVRLTNRNGTNVTSSIRLAIGGETSDRATFLPTTAASVVRAGFGTTAPHSTVQSAGSFAGAILDTNGAPTFDETKWVVSYSGSSSITWTLPAASTCAGRHYTLFHRGSLGTITLSTTITKGNTGTWNTLTAGQFGEIWSDGTGWIGYKLTSQ